MKSIHKNRIQLFVLFGMKYQEAYRHKLPPEYQRTYIDQSSPSQRDFIECLLKENKWNVSYLYSFSFSNTKKKINI